MKTVVVDHPLMGPVKVDAKLLTDRNYQTPVALELRQLAEEQGILVDGNIVEEDTGTIVVGEFAVRNKKGGQERGTIELITSQEVAEETIESFRKSSQ